MTATLEKNTRRNRPTRRALEKIDVGWGQPRKMLEIEPVGAPEDRRSRAAGGLTSSRDQGQDARTLGVGVNVASSDPRPAAAAGETPRALTTNQEKKGWLNRLDGFSVARLLLIVSLLLGIFFTGVFGFDLITGWLFWRASVLMDVGFSLCGLALIWLCCSTFRETR